MENLEKYADPSGFMKAAHNPDNCLLVWWYNPFTGDFRKTREKNAQHKDSEIFGLEKEELLRWFRGRVFKFNDKIYLIIYVFGAKIIDYSFLDDLFNLIYQTLGVIVNNVIDDEGNDLKQMFESWKYYSEETLQAIKERIKGL